MNHIVASRSKIKPNKTCGATSCAEHLSVKEQSKLYYMVISYDNRKCAAYSNFVTIQKKTCVKKQTKMGISSYFHHTNETAYNSYNLI